MSTTKDKEDEEVARRVRRANLKKLNLEQAGESPSKALDSSLKRHTALIKRMRQSLGTDNHDQIEKDLNTLSLGKYVDEIVQAVLEGVGRCKTERDVWSAVEIICMLHRRFPTTFTPALVSSLGTALAAPAKGSLASLTPEQREKEDSARVARQRPVLRVCAELALVDVIRDKDQGGRSGGEWIMKALRELLSNDPTLSSLPLLSTFLKAYARPYLGLVPPVTNKQQVSEESEPGGLAPTISATEEHSHNGTNGDAQQGAFPALLREEDELVEKEIRERFKKMCDGYYDSVSKKLVLEHKRLQEQDRRNHEAYIRSGEIFEDRQQAYEKMTKGYEKLLASCQTLSELLYHPMPNLPAQAQKTDSIQLSLASGQDHEEIYVVGGKWEDEEERKFFEDLQDLKDFVPKSLLGLDEKGERSTEDGDDLKELEEKARKEKERDEEDLKKMEEELNKLKIKEEMKDSEDKGPIMNEDIKTNGDVAMKDNRIDDEDDLPTPVPSPPKTPSPPGTPTLAPQGPSQLLTALLIRLPDATNRSMIDQAAVDFAFLNSKAARKRLVKFFSQVPKNRVDLLPHYSRLVATLNPYMPDIGAELISTLEDEFRYLQRKKNVVKELSEVRQKNIAFLSNLTKFRIVPNHVILHIFKVCLDDFSGVNVDNVALLLEGCGRFLLRSDETKERFSTMVELMRRKQNMQHLDQRQLLALENAYYQCNPPEHAPRIEKERTPMELFIRHLISDVLAKRTLDKVLRLIRKLNWDDPIVKKTLHSVFTKVWKAKYSHISLIAMLAYDLQRYRPEFCIGVVDQVLEDIRRGLETNVYKANQQRVATMRYLGELYIYRLVTSGIVFETLWTLVTYGHPEGRPLPGQICPIDMPDDFFRVRLVCVLLDVCGMCFDKGTQKKKLDDFLTFLQLYIFTKEEIPMDVEFMLNDSLEAVRPQLQMYKNFEEAARAVDAVFNIGVDISNKAPEPEGEGEERDDDSSDEGVEGEGEGGEVARRPAEEDDQEDMAAQESPTEERAPSPDTLVLLSTPENLGPSQEEESEFAKELAKMVTDSSAEARKVDKRTAQALWDSSVMPSTLRKKIAEDSDDDEGSELYASQEPNVMKFTVLTKRGNKQLAKRLAIPATSALAMHTRSAQEHDREEQEQLKRLVLDYEQREEYEEFKAIENRNRAGGGLRIRMAG